MACSLEELQIEDGIVKDGGGAPGANALNTHLVETTSTVWPRFCAAGASPTLQSGRAGRARYWRHRESVRE
jgi:mannose/cellobiose epimerase-like protein (N-acyl-D-glucosamine 2-epimerase family)